MYPEQCLIPVLVMPQEIVALQRVIRNLKTPITVRIDPFAGAGCR